MKRRTNGPGGALPAPWLMAVASAGALLVASCGPAASGQLSDAGTPRQGSPTTLRIALQGQHEPTGGIVDPGRSSTGSARLEHFYIFHASLTVLDPQNTALPRMAVKIPTLQDGDWKTFPDGRMEVVWKLRPNLFWHDGTPLSSDDLILGIRLQQDPDLPGTPSPVIAQIAELAAPDAQTLIVSWRVPSIFGNIAGPDVVSAAPRHLLLDLYQSGDKDALINSPYWTRDFIGIGPYRLGSWDLGSHIEALAFDRYFLGRPPIDRIVIRYIGDVNALVANLLSGDIDITPVGALMDPGQMMAVRQGWEPEARGTTLPIPKGVRTIYLQFRDPAAPWAGDLRVRQALVHAADRQVIADTLQFGLTTPADFYVRTDDPTYRLVAGSAPRYPYDTRRAERLLAEAGWVRSPGGLLQGPTGQRLTFEVAATAQGDNVKEAETIVSQWNQAGVDARLKPITSRGADRDVDKNTARGGLIWPFSFGLTPPDALLTTEIASDQNRWKGSNYGGYTNPTYDALNHQFLATLDPSQRSEVMAGIVRLMAEDVPVIPLYYVVLSMAARNGIAGPGSVSAVHAASAWNIHEWEVKS